MPEANTHEFDWEQYKKDLMGRITHWTQIFNGDFSHITADIYQSLISSWNDDRVKLREIMNANGDLHLGRGTIIKFAAFVPYFETFIKAAQRFFGETVSDSNPWNITTDIRTAKAKLLNNYFNFLKNKDEDIVSKFTSFFGNESDFTNEFIKQRNPNVLRVLCKVNRLINLKSKDDYFKKAQQAIDKITKEAEKLPIKSVERTAAEKAVSACQKELAKACQEIDRLEADSDQTNRAVVKIKANCTKAMNHSVKNDIINNNAIPETSALQAAARVAAWTFSILTLGIGAAVLMSTVGKQAFFAPNSAKVRRSATELNNAVSKALLNTVQTTPLTMTASAA